MDKKRKIKLLIVDDSEMLRKRLGKLIGCLNSGIQITEAATGTQALDLFRSAVHEAVILDISLPDRSGIEILKEIKILKSDTTVMIFTNYPSPEFRERCINLGADYFFDKYSEYSKLLDCFKGSKIIPGNENV